jgi:hypothetical protein
MIAISTWMLLLATSPGDAGERLLLCRPSILGEAGQARGEAVATAAQALPGALLDYGVPCQGAAEAARAARRAGLGYAVLASAEGSAVGSTYVLALAGAERGEEIARRELTVSAAIDAVPPLERALRDLVGSVRPPEAPAAPRPRRIAPWIVAGAGVAGLAAGGVFALVAGSQASARDKAGAAGDVATYVHKDISWRGWRTASGVALGVGAAALAAGLVWRVAL